MFWIWFDGKFEEKKNYLNNFLKKRVLSILIPYSLCRVIGYISDIYINYDSKSLFYYLNPKIIFKNIILFDHNWFACEIIILYFLFYLLFKLFQNRNLNRFIILILSWLIIFIPTYYSNSEKHIKYIFVRVVYHQAIGSFIYGLLIGEYEKIIIIFINKYFYIFFNFSLLFPFYYYIFTKYIRDLPLETGKYLNFWLYVTKYNILSILMYSCVLIITMKIQLNNIILDYLGKFTFENYLYHTLLLKLDKNIKIIVKTESVFWKYFGLIMVSLYIGEKIHYLDNFLISLINKDDNKIIKNNSVDEINYKIKIK